jgi:hypothetical protein
VNSTVLIPDMPDRVTDKSVIVGGIAPGGLAP